MKLDPIGLAAATAACRDNTFDALTMDECRDVVKLAVTAYLNAIQPRYACSVCKTYDETRYLRCNYPGCTDGRG